MRLLERLRAVPHIGTYTGLAFAVAGLGLIAFAWGRTAGLADVGLQMPYVLSAAFPGLGLVIAGLTVVNLSAKRADARERSRQLAELRDLVAELRQLDEER